MPFRTTALGGHVIAAACKLSLMLIFPALLLVTPLAAAQSQGTVTGHITNGTAAATVPADLKISLVISQQGAAPQQFSTTPLPDGSFTFAAVPIIPDADYVTAVLYRDHLFNSSFVKGAAGTSTLDLPITIYEPTEDPAVISIIGTVIQITQTDTTLEFRQVIRFHNSSDRIFTSSQDLGDGRYASLVVPLPPGAQVISFDNADRYVISQDKFTIIDTAPVFPGDDNQILVVYILPYDGTPSLIEQPFNYPFDGQARLLLHPESLGITSAQLPALDKETLSDQEYQAYGAALQLKPGDIIRYQIGGATPTPVPVSAAPANNSGIILLLALVVIGIIGVIILLALRMRQPAAPTTGQLIDALTRQIEALDQKQASGELNHDIWHRQRAALQARLNQLRGEENSDESP